MNCPECGSMRVVVTNVLKPCYNDSEGVGSRRPDLRRMLGSENAIARARDCRACGLRFHTMERVAEVPPPAAREKSPECGHVKITRRGRPAGGPCGYPAVWRPTGRCRHAERRCWHHRCKTCDRRPGA